ncbi:cholinesterase-like isoform X1 [Zootoca vivipara]|uniref:cholinesterase-like isoform X1 n=2 Tax=Zootoca vivipara TaxID=8524 RepID=UPI00293B87DF|nr:cholinesterase-like isoform X1 [Zootoca vivipara]
MSRCSHAQVFFIRESGSSAVPNFPLQSGLQGILRSRNIHQAAAAMLHFWTLPSSFCLLLFLLPSSSASDDDDTVVVTSSGPIKGKILPAGTGSVTAYLGIPYAEPPVGKLRFQKPVPHQPWSQALEATTFGNSCHQLNIEQMPFSELYDANTPLSEDCLFLNIWVPHPRPVTPVPILLWIYGGGFIMGTASLDMYNGALLAATENVIVASMNYRLGSLGFLYLPPDAPGNVGLWDQHLALKWVSENAAVFGGDAARITLLGESAGGAAVGFHLLSPASQPLFARAVLQSGVPNAPWGWKNPENALRDSVIVSRLMGCHEANHSAMVSCLQGMEMNSKTFAALQAFLSLTTDGEFLPDDPPKRLEIGLVHGKPILAGVTADEGSTTVFFMYPNMTLKDGKLTWEQALEAVKGTFTAGAKKDVDQDVLQKYTEGSHGLEQYHLAMAHYMGDYNFVCPLLEFAEKVGKDKNPVYVYSFDHRSPDSIWPEWAGTPHGAEVPYLFGSVELVLQTNRSEVKAAEVELSRQVMRYWAEFARSGNPTGSMRDEAQWPVYNATEQKFFHIGTDVAGQLKRMSPSPRCEFLSSLHSKATQTEKSPEVPASSTLEKDVNSATQT